MSTKHRSKTSSSKPLSGKPLLKYFEHSSLLHTLAVSEQLTRLLSNRVAKLLDIPSKAELPFLISINKLESIEIICSNASIATNLKYQKNQLKKTLINTLDTASDIPKDISQRYKSLIIKGVHISVSPSLATIGKKHANNQQASGYPLPEYQYKQTITVNQNAVASVSSMGNNVTNESLATSLKRLAKTLETMK